MQLIIPAAGRGTRLTPLTDACPKELLPLGGRPVLDAALLEAAHAGVDDITLVVSPTKPRLTSWADGRTRIAIQPEARGSLHAIACAKPTPPYAVLFPDYVHAAGQRALAGLLEAAAARPDATWFGVVWLDEPERMGSTARVDLDADGRITAVHTDRIGPAWHTAFAEVRGAEHARRIDAGPLDDARVMGLLQGLAADGLVYGHRLMGPILDVGISAGYADAQARFDDGRGWWRETDAD
ncbi:MAG: hypothetical protein ACI9U2_001110 [Bradymonadia bacterium]|jgi:hypothetical protein